MDGNTCKHRELSKAETCDDLYHFYVTTWDENFMNLIMTAELCLFLTSAKP
jgi:hypothetical protein